MANILDIRRRIRSVINTRQITKAMKMVSAAKLRRAQERALAARPYAQMLTNVLKSLVSRAEIYDPETGEPRHPLLARRPRKTFCCSSSPATKVWPAPSTPTFSRRRRVSWNPRQEKNVEIETIGRKGRDFLRRRFPAAEPARADRQEAPYTTIVGEHIGMLNKVEYAMASEIGGTRHRALQPAKRSMPSTWCTTSSSR